MDHIILKTKRTEMKFPPTSLTPAAIVNAIKDEETIRFMDAVPTMEYTEENASSFLDFLQYTRTSETELELGIFDRSTDRFIGMCSLENINPEYRVCELGYWLDKAYTGKGYMTECATALLQFAKDTLHMKAVNAFVITKHRKSIRLLEKLGFIQKKLLKDDTDNKGKMTDRYWYQLIL